MNFTAVRTTSLALLLLLAAASARVIRTDDLIRFRHGTAKVSAEAVRSTVEAAFRQLRPGDGLVLPMRYPLGSVNAGTLPDRVQLIGGYDGQLNISGTSRNLTIIGAENVALVSGTSEGGLLKRGRILLDSAMYIYTTGPIDLTGDIKNSYWIDHSTDSIHFLGSAFGTKSGFKYVTIDGNMSNCTMLYLRYNNESDKSLRPSVHLKLHGSGQGVKVLMMIEHSQANASPAMVIDQGADMQFAHGSTEGCGVRNQAVYQLINCKRIHMAQRRIYSNHNPGSTWYGTPTFSLQVTGGEGNILDNFMDIGNPISLSAVISDPKIRIWNSSFEDDVRLTGTDPERFLICYTPQSMITEIDKWTEPPLAANEVIYTYETSAGKVDLTSSAAKLPDGVPLPVPPAMPACNIPKAPGLLYKRAAGFGRDLLAAGADPTGRCFSDAAFRSVLAEKGLLEIPAGTFRLERTLDMNAIPIGARSIFDGRKRWIVGAGEGVSRIVGPSRGAILSYTGTVAKRDTTIIPRQINGDFITGLTLEGSDYGLHLVGGFKPDVVAMNVHFRNQRVAGVNIESSSPNGPHEQNRFISCRFDSTGDYGIRMNGYSDKYLFYRCHFAGQRKGGIYCTQIVHFHSGVYQSSFQNIGGPAIAILGGNESYGYGPWICTVDSCRFVECGSDSQPVVDFGYSYNSVFSNSVVTTRSRSIYAGFRGNFAVIDNIQFDLNLTNGVAMYLGHQRFEKTARNQGSRVTRTSTNGKIEFLDYKQFVTGNYLVTAPINYTGPQWWDDPTTYAWAYPYIFYKVKSDNYTTEYALICDGEVIDMTKKSSVSVARQVATATASSLMSQQAFDLCGRAIPVSTDNCRAGSPGTAHGVRLFRQQGNAAIARKLVLR